jgi:hypothetical protein
MKSVKAIILSAVAFGLLGSGSVAYLSLQDQDFVWGAPAVLFVIGVLAAGHGLWRFRAWALKLSWALAGLALAFGIYIAHFRWTFWLFQDPNLWDRILSVLDPRGSLYVIIPLAWVFYSRQRFVRSQFK